MFKSFIIYSSENQNKNQKMLACAPVKHQKATLLDQVFVKVSRPAALTSVPPAAWKMLQL